MHNKKTRKKRVWCRSIIAMVIMVGMFLSGHPYHISAGTTNHTASISKTVSGDNYTFTCNLEPYIDGQITVYQWEENSGSGWHSISGANGTSYTVNKAGHEGYQYRCHVTGSVPNTYRLMNECYKAFLHRQGVESEFQHWWFYLFSHTQDEYLETIYNTLGTSPVNEAAGVAMEIVFSDEYMKKYFNNHYEYNPSVNGDTVNGPKQLIVDCYRFLLQRVPTYTEVENWYNVYEANNNGGLSVALRYPDGNGVSYLRETYFGMGHVINGIAGSAECAEKMAATYYYNGVIGEFLYEEDDCEHRKDPINAYTGIETIPVTPTYTVTVSKGTGIDSVSGGGQYTAGQFVTVNATVSSGYRWGNWTGTYTSNNKQYTFAMPASDVSLTANGILNSHTLTVKPNGGTWSGSTNDQTFTLNQGATKVIANPSRTGYTFTGWTLSGTGSSMSGTTFTMGSANATLTANWRVNSYTIQFFPNEGTEVNHINDIAVTYDQSMILPNGADFYEKYTQDGVTVTEEGVVNYASVFKGWTLENSKDIWIPQWCVGEISVNELVTVAGKADEDGATIALYAVWDDCPWIEATNLYYTLEQAQSGFITDQEILSHTTASDREDGSPIAPGFHENGTSYSIPDYTPEDFTGFWQEGSVTENLTVVDSVGSMYVKQITVFVVDTAPVAAMPEGTTRFIDEKYYQKSYENGGLEENSIWKTDIEYVAAIQQAFSNVRNHSAMQTYRFTQEEILQMKEYINTHGVECMKDVNALQEFYTQFVMPNQI